MYLKGFLRTSCAVLALGALPTIAHAQAEGSSQPANEPDQQDETGGPEENRPIIEERAIVVTGSRFGELLDDTQPASVISAEDRNLAGVNSARELVLAQPGFNFNDTFGISVRGVGRQTAQTLLGQENTVLQYVDGFLNLVPSNISESTLFGGNVTFVRGPAGTKYGRNAIAGAINVISRSPTPELTAQAVVGLQREGGWNIGTNISGPITDNLGFRFGFQRFKSPTVFDNIGGEGGAGSATDNQYFEFQLEWEVGPLHVRNRATTFRYDNQPGYPTLSRYNNGLNGNTSAVFGDLSPNPQFGFDGEAPDEPYQTNVNFVGYDRLRDNFQNVLNVDLDLGFADLVYVGGYQTYRATGSSDRDLTSRTSYDGDIVAPGTFEPGAQVPTDYRTNYDNDNFFWSQEARLEGNGGGPLSWVLGYYHFNQDFDEQYWENIVNATDVILEPVIGTPGLPSSPTNPRRATFEQRNLYEIRSDAVFGNIVWDISPTWQLDAGLRHTWDEKEALTNFRFVYYYPPLYAADFSPLVHGAETFRQDEGLSGRASIAWRPAPGDQIYAAYSRGYQASALTLGQGLPPNNVADKQFLDVFEIGGNVTRGPVRFDGSIFYQVFTDQQIPISTRGVFVGPDGPAPGPIFSTFTNAGETEIYGLEAQLSIKPNADSNIFATYTYLHPTFKDFCPSVSGSSSCGVIDISEPATIDGEPNPLAGVLQDLSGNEVPRTPRHKLSLYGYYGINLGSAGRIYPGGSVYYQSSFYTSAFTLDRFRVPGRGVVNATLTYRTADDRLDITGVISNLFKARYADNTTLATFGGGTVSQAVTYGADRYWTLTARYRF